jgi:hypothetical protein
MAPKFSQSQKGFEHKNITFVEAVHYHNVIGIFMQSFLPLCMCCYNKSKICGSRRHNVYEGTKKNIISVGNE